ncbi:MAG: RnfH family protein [Brachymonas sp.]|nr:RnfH family protein [Brachymonas sp.]
MANSDALVLTVVYAPQPRTVLEIKVTLPAGSTVRDALWATGWADRLEVRELLEKGPEVAPLACGIWGKKRGLDHVLQANDRVEIYRSLLVDPKVARRERFAKQGIRAAGLFAGRRRK